MVMMMTASLLPFSAFAAKEDDKVEIVGGIQEFSGLDEKQPVSILVDLGNNAALKRGQVEINLKNVRTADMDNPVSAKFVQDGKEVGIETIVTFEDKFDSKALKGGEDRFVMRLSGKDLNESGDSKTKLMITLNLNFSESKLGDADINFQDLSETGMRNFTATIADFVDGMQRDMSIKTEDNTARIGQYGGALSQFSITRFDTLDSVKANNEVRMTLPRALEFDKTTVVKLDGKELTPTYNKEKNQMMVYGVVSSSSSLVINPVIKMSGTDVPYGNVEMMIEFLVNKRTVNTKIFDIGKITDDVVEIVVNEKGKTRIPKIANGSTGTVEITLKGVIGSFEKNGYVDFDINGIDVPFKFITINEPKSKVILEGESAGKSAGNLINGKEVYKDGKFSLKVMDPQIKQISFTMDVTANTLANGMATIEVSSNEFKTVKANLTEVNANLLVKTDVSFAQKGSLFKSANIVMEETKSGNLNTGDKLYLSLDKAGMGFDTDTLVIKTTSDLELSKPRKNDKGIIEIEVLKKSYNAPAKIELSSVKIYSAEDSVSGMAQLEIKRNSDVVYQTDYVKIVGNIPDVTVFTIGNKAYMASGVQKKAVEAPYIKTGYTMLPVRALAEALGLSSNWNNATKTAMFSGDVRVATVKLGDSEMIVNGVSYKLAVPAEIKNGATMIELRSLATAFGISISWDGTQKTASVTSN